MGKMLTDQDRKERKYIKQRYAEQPVRGRLLRFVALA